MLIFALSALRGRERLICHNDDRVRPYPAGPKTLEIERLN